MKEPDNTEIEFEIEESVADKTDLQGSDEKIVRRWFRVPLKDSDEIVFNCAGVRYETVNFSKAGISIRLPDEPFVQGELLPHVELTLAGQVLSLTAKVVCIYSDEEGNQVCGLSFVDPDEASEQLIDKTYWHLRNQLFSNE